MGSRGAPSFLLPYLLPKPRGAVILSAEGAKDLLSPRARRASGQRIPRSRAPRDDTISRALCVTAGPSLARCARSLRMTALGDFGRKERVEGPGPESSVSFSFIAERARLIILSAAGAKDMLFQRRKREGSAVGHTEGSKPRRRSAPCNTGSTRPRRRSFAYPTHATSAVTSNGASTGVPLGSRTITPASSAMSAVQRS